MVKIIAVVKPFVLEQVLQAIDEFEIFDVTIEEVRGYGTPGISAYGGVKAKF